MTGKGLFALNEGTIPNRNIVCKLKATKKAGFQGIGIWYQNVLQANSEGTSMEEIYQNIEKSNIEVVELDFLRDWMFAEGVEKKEKMIEAEKMFEVAYRIKAKCLCAAAFGEQGDIEVAIKNFKDLCSIGQKYKIDVGLEFLPWQQVSTLNKAWEIVKSANKENGGLIIDTFHFFKGGSALWDLDKIPVNKILLIHINDLKNTHSDLDLVTMTRNDRVFPGYGEFDLVGFVQKMREKKYTGFYSLEVLNKDFAKLDEFKIAYDGIESMENLWKKL